MDGFMVVDKPPGLSSHDVVAMVRAVTGIKKVGHTGTLDPFATGVLPLALGGATRWIQYLDESLKIYDAHLTLGSATDTGDPDGAVIATAPIPSPTRAQVEEVLQGFIGKRVHMPPRYSAVKVNGRPLYDYARAGQTVEVKPRTIEVYGMELLEHTEGLLRIRMRCSRGTYARVLGEEIAVALGTVGHLTALRREGSGAFHISQAVTLAQLAQVVAGDVDWAKVLRPARGEARVPWRSRAEVSTGLQPWVRPPADFLTHLPTLRLAPAEQIRYRQSGVLPAWAKPREVPVLILGDDLLGVLPAAKLDTSPSIE